MMPLASLAQFQMQNFAQAAGWSASDGARAGVGLGSVIAVVCSWQRNRSIWWAILAGIFSWFYVIYFAATRKPEERKSG